MSGADTLYMGLFLRGSDAVVMTLVRALGLYFGFYFGIFVLAPFLVTFDAWSIVPLWGWMLVAVSLDVVRNLVQDCPPVQPIRLADPRQTGVSTRRCEVGPGLRHRHPIRGPRIARVRHAAPPHRRVRFGRTRLR